jgi:hypothetical protein
MKTTRSSRITETGSITRSERPLQSFMRGQTVWLTHTAISYLIKANHFSPFTAFSTYRQLDTALQLQLCQDSYIDTDLRPLRRYRELGFSIRTMLIHALKTNLRFDFLWRRDTGLDSNSFYFWHLSMKYHLSQGVYLGSTSTDSNITQALHCIGIGIGIQKAPALAWTIYRRSFSLPESDRCWDQWVR